MTLILNALQGVPLIQPGDDLSALTFSLLNKNSLTLEDGDVLVFAQKVISKAEDRYRQLSTQVISPQAQDLADQTGKDPGLVELILQESNEVLRVREGLIVVEHRLGFVCANAGIDHSNLDRDEDWVLLLPENPDQSAAVIRDTLQSATGKSLAVLIIDSHGRAWRNGVSGVSIGLAGLPGVVDKRGEVDMQGRVLRVTTIGVADELAAAASLVMGQAEEGTPIVHVRGFPYALRESGLSELIRTKEHDLFR